MGSTTLTIPCCTPVLQRKTPILLQVAHQEGEYLASLFRKHPFRVHTMPDGTITGPGQLHAISPANLVVAPPL